MSRSIGVAKQRQIHVWRQGQHAAGGILPLVSVHYAGHHRAQALQNREDQVNGLLGQ